jgi:hypothetical protein
VKLTTDVDLAADFDITVEELHRLRKKHGWPFVPFGRFKIRFTDEQIEQIVATQSVVPEAKEPAAGLTARSASRRRSA